MKKQGAVIKHKKSKIVEKSILLSKSIQLKLDFDLQVSAWIPAAKINKPMPQVNLTINVSYDDIRLGCNTTEELIDGLMEIVSFLSKNKEVLNNSAKAEQQRWLDLCNMQHARLQGLKVIEMKSA
jgi:hypothetical protein